MAQVPSSANDRNAIRKIQRDFAKAWNQGDPNAMAANWAGDGDMINPFGREVRGQAGVEKLFAEERHTFAQGSYIAVDVKSIRFFNPDVAMVDCAFEVTGAHAPDGRELPPLKGLYANVLTRKQGKWQVAACRVMVPAPAPA
jgi:uncharacterized protein (TIGR02246 family)